VSLRALAMLASCTALACSSADAGDASTADAADSASSSDSGSGSGARSDSGAAALLEVTGNFQIDLVPEVLATADRPAAAPFTKLVGQALDGKTPESPVWTMTAQDGDCQLFVPSLPFCDPTCANSTVCVAGGVCAGYPRGIDLGTVTLRGVQGEQSIAMKPVPPKYTYQLPGSAHLSYPPFAPGDEVRIEVEGGEVPAFTVGAPAIAPLELLGAHDVDFTADAATALRWTPARSEGTRIRVLVDVSHHGGRKGEIRCDVEDSGALDISAALGAKLIELGLAGNPTVDVIRESASSVAVAAGRVGLRVASKVTRPLRIPGLIACTAPGAQDVCPDGQLCQPEHRCL